jgi:energy-coupling factor transporter ATP-binding protein EcfA2
MKLHELHINNFKFFPKQDPKSPLLKIEGKNLLIYGENGSGKSTIYWALYTLLESAFKKNEFEVEKYFKKNGAYGLVNIYATKSSPPFIKVVLKDSDGNNPKEYLVNPNLQQIVENMGNSSIRESGMASDFLNYRAIFRLHHIKHSKENNLFGWFEDEIFPYILIESISKTESVDDNYKSLKTGPKKVKDFDEIDKMIFPNLAMREHPQEAVRKDYAIYKKYSNSVKRWNNKISHYITEITKRANVILKDDFKQNFEFALNFKAATHDVSPYNPNWKDPVIDLHVKKYEGKSNVVKRAHSFLNEAKWSAIGLAIRFAIIEDWTNRPTQAELKALIIDDMLLSLDMCNRDIVLNLLLDRYVNNYQLILMTHDRSFYEFAKRKIAIKGTSKNWLNMEMFEDTLAKFPKPYFKPLNTSLQTAKDYLNQHDYPACGIYLRRRTEELLKNLLPLKFQKEPSRDDPHELVDKTLNGLILELENYCITEGIDYNGLKEIKIYKDAILNPLAHNDIDAPFYRSELKSIIEVIERLEKIQRANVVHHPNHNCNFTLFKLNGDFFSVRMKAKEQILLLTENIKSPRISIFTKCKVSSYSNNGTITTNEENFDTLREVYDEMCNRFGIPTKQDISREFNYDGKTFDQRLIEMGI